MPDFKVLRGSSILPTGTLTITLTDGVDYSLETGIASDAWFFQIANSKFTGMGDTVGGGNQNGDDITVHVTVSGNDVTLTRAGAADPNRVDWQIIQYVGEAGGANEIKVRQKGLLTLTNGVTTGSVAVPGSVVSASDVVPFITGQSTTDTGRRALGSALFTSVLNGANFDFQRGDNEDTGRVSYALVEFVGSNWTVGNETFTNPSGTGEQTVAISGVSDVTQTFLHCTYRYDLNNAQGLDDASVRVALTGPSTLTITDTTATDDTDKNHSVWLIENPDMTVARYSGTMAGAGEEEIFNVTVTEVADVEQTLTTLSNDSTGGGTAFPRGFINHLLDSASNVLMRQSDNGQTSRYSLEVVELPESAGGGPLTGTVRIWDGSAWVDKPVKVWDGSAWVTKPLKRWNGTGWV